MDVPKWAPLFEETGQRHVALIYRDEPYLAEAVARWSARALRPGGGAILVGAATHALEIRGRLRRLGIDVEGAERAGRLVFLDADWLMAHFILEGNADGPKFRALCSEIVGGVRAKAGGANAPVRAWGEMVSLLRLRGTPATAIRLEELWTEVIAEHDIALLCSYDATHGGSAAAGVAAEIAGAHGELVVQPPSSQAGFAASVG